MEFEEIYSIKVDGHAIYIYEDGMNKFILENIPDFLKRKIAEIMENESIKQ